MSVGDEKSSWDVPTLREWLLLGVGAVVVAFGTARGLQETQVKPGAAPTSAAVPSGAIAVRPAPIPTDGYAVTCLGRQLHCPTGALWSGGVPPLCAEYCIACGQIVREAIQSTWTRYRWPEGCPTPTDDKWAAE